MALVVVHDQCITENINTDRALLAIFARQRTSCEKAPRLAEKQYLQSGRVCDVVEIPQSLMATTTSQPPVRGIRDCESTEGHWPISDAH